MKEDMPLLAVVKEDGTKQTFPKTTTEQVRQSLEEKYKVRKRHDIKELVANTDPAFLKDAWEEENNECYKCASETQLGDTVNCRCKPEPKVTQFDRAEALDRISTIQGMLSLLLVDLNYEEGSRSHKGLSHDAEWLVSEAMEKLREAYQAQGLYVFDEGEAMNDKLTQQVWRFMKGGEDAS